MQKAFGEFEAALHASRESLGSLVGAIEEVDARQHFFDAGLEGLAVESVEVSLMPEVFFRGELDVDALCLEDDADLAAAAPRMTARPPLGSISVERMRKRVVLPLPLGPSSPNSSAAPTSKETPSRAVRFSYLWTMCSTEMTAAGARSVSGASGASVGDLMATGYFTLPARSTSSGRTATASRTRWPGVSCGPGSWSERSCALPGRSGPPPLRG